MAGRDGMAAVRASGCSSMLHFLSTLRLPLLRIYLKSEGYISFESNTGGEDLDFDVDGLRAQEEGREAGSFLRFLTALPSSCKELRIGTRDVELASEQELSALLDAIASSTCTLPSLGVDGKITTRLAASTQSFGALLGDALCRNTSLTRLHIASDVMNIEEHLLPALLTRHRSASPLQSLHVELKSDHTLDCVLEIFAALALNTLSLTRLMIIDSQSEAHYNYACEAELGTMLSTNSSLNCLVIWGCYLPGRLVLSLFNSLQNNVHLTSLVLAHSRGKDWPAQSSIACG